MSRTVGHTKRCARRTCAACSLVDRSKMRTAKAPTGDLTEHDLDHVYGYWMSDGCEFGDCDSDGYESDDDGRLSPQPLRVPLIEAARVT